MSDNPWKLYKACGAASYHLWKEPILPLPGYIPVTPAEAEAGVMVHTRNCSKRLRKESCTFEFSLGYGENFESNN